MTDLRTAARQALTILEAWKHKGMWGDWDGVTDALKAALAEDAMQKFTDVNQELEAALAEPVEPDPWGASYEAGYEAGVARRPAQPVQDHFPDATKMVQDADLWSAGYAAGYAAGMEECPAEPVQQGCDHCNHPLYAATKCRVCGRVTEPTTEDSSAVEPVQPVAHKHEWFSTGAMKPGQMRCIHCGVWNHEIPPQRPAEPAQEPVAWLTPGQDLHLNNGEGFRFSDWTPLYTAPPQRKPLTDEEIYSLFRTVASPVMFARAIERAHGIGGQP